MSPLTGDSRAKHNKVVEKAIKESVRAQRQKTKRKRRMNSKIRNAGGFFNNGAT